MRRQSEAGEDAADSSTRPSKVRKTQRKGDATREVEAGAQGGSDPEVYDNLVWEPDSVNVSVDDGESVLGRNGNAAAASQDEQGPEPRSCENCRRCKLKCSRSKPCTKCVLKDLPCVYEQSDKKRGPRPGYIEELYRRIDTLENIVLGQSLLRARDGKSPVPQTLEAAVNYERERLDSLGVNSRQAQAKGQEGQPQIRQLPRRLSGSSPLASQQPTPQSLSTAQDSRLSDTSSAFAFDTSLPTEALEQTSWVYYHQIQPWLPLFRQLEVTGLIPQDDHSKEPPHPVLQAVIAAASPLDADSPFDRQRGLSWLHNYGLNEILRAASLDNLRVSLLLQFLLFGNGNISDFWGLVVYPAQVAIQAGLHLEDHHLSPSQRNFRRMVGFHDSSQTWVGKETDRRLFWIIFLQDHFAALFSGSTPSFDVANIRRLLPCDGQRWQDNQPIHTHEFVPASVAIQVQAFADSNIGGLAYLIEATEVQALVAAFINRFREGPPAKQDPRASLQEFLNLDLILTNWKAKLPGRYQKASYDDNGYMDHNITLAHLTHNTTGILLYHWPYTLWGTSTGNSGLQTSLFSQVLVVKQAAKEIAKISTRFLLHRRYLVSPQFSFCQFMAARALLAYSQWMMEPLDEDFDTLYTSLGESAKRWSGTQTSTEHRGRSKKLNNLAGSLQARLDIDMKQPRAINLATPGVELLRKMAEDDTSAYQHTPTTQVSSSQLADLRDHGSLREAASQLEPLSDAGRVASMEAVPYMGDGNHLEQAMSLLASTQTGGLDTRIFSWHDSPDMGMVPPLSANLG
ncbi:hypothetical protein CC79DRAFT_1401852 [Sarocladium strictum]